MNTQTFRNLLVISNTFAPASILEAVNSSEAFRFQAGLELDVAVQFDDDSGLPEILYTESNENNFSADEVGDMILFFAGELNEHDLELMHG